MKLYERVRFHIKENGLLIKFVANRSGINYKRLCRLLEGRNQMTADEFEAICVKGLQVDPNIFFKDNIRDSKTCVGDSV